MHVPILFLLLLVNLIVCRDFYLGMFKRNDFLVAQDRLYKEKVFGRKVIAKYGRIFKCPITYFRVVDRLGIGRGPYVEILRGGLLKKFIVIRLISPYNYPISVNIYVGCENKVKELTVPTTKAAVKTEDNTKTDTTTVADTIDAAKNVSKDEKAVTDPTTVTNATVDSNSTSANKTG